MPAPIPHAFPPGKQCLLFYPKGPEKTKEKRVRSGDEKSTRWNGLRRHCHPPLELVDGASAKARNPGRLGNAYALGQLDAGAFELVGLSSWSAEPPAHDAGFRGEFASRAIAEPRRSCHSKLTRFAAPAHSCFWHWRKVSALQRGRSPRRNVTFSTASHDPLVLAGVV